MIKKRFLRKVIALYSGIVLLYSTAIVGVTFFQGMRSSSIRDEYNNTLFLNQVGSYADSRFLVAFEFANKISTLDTLIDYQYSDDSNYLYITNLYNDLVRDLNSFTHLGFSLGITKFTDNIVISPSGTSDCQRYFRDIGIDPEKFSHEFSNPDFDLSFNTTIIPKEMMLPSSNQIVLLHRPYGKSLRTPVYFLISVDAHSLLPQNTYNALGSFSLYNKGENRFYFSNFADDNTELSGELQDLPLDESYVKTKNFDNFIRHSEIVPGLIYVYTVSHPSLFSVFLDVLQVTLVPGLILLLVGIGLSLFAARSSYLPVQRILHSIENITNKTNPKESDVFNELEYVQNYIEQMHSANRDLQNKLDGSLTFLQEDFFRKIIYGVSSEEAIHKNVSNLKLEAFEKSDLRCILLDCSGIESLNQILPIQNFPLIIRQIINSEYPDQQGVKFFVLPLDVKSYFIIIPGLSEEEIRALTTVVMQKLSDEFTLDITACLSGTYPLTRLSDALHELLSLHKYKYSAGNEDLITTETIQKIPDVTYYYPIEAEISLIKYINENEKERAQELLADIIDRNLENPNVAAINFANLKYSIITTFKRCLNAEGKSLTFFVRKNPKAIDQFLNVPMSDFKEACFRLFGWVFENCNQDKHALENSISSSILIYIHENFDKDISLSDIATHFNLSESYVSKLLKNSLGINFKTYVNMLKVKKAKSLLAENRYRINEVARIVGCNNANTFIRIFKQYAGVSPGEYMKNSMHSS